MEAFRKATRDRFRSNNVHLFQLIFLPYQEGGSRDGKGLLVEIGAAEQQQDICVVLGLVEVEELSQLPQFLQV